MIYNDPSPTRIRGRIWFTLLVLFFGYGIINVFVPNGDMIIATRVIQASASAVVLYVYFGDFWHGLRTPDPARGDYLIVGIWVGFFATLCQAIYSMAFRLAGNPAWLLNSEVNAPYILLSVVAAVMHVSAPGAVDGVVPRRNRLAMGVGFGAAVFLVICLFMIRPDIRPVLDRLRPYIEDLWRQGQLVTTFAGAL